ncbi:hypothetical protein C3L33_02411, partial [Rhododendron williamsianum]
MLVSHPNPQLFNHHHKNKKLGTLRPTNQNQSLLELGFNRWSQRRRRCNSTVRPQSVLSVDDKVLKSAIKADRNSNDYRYDVIIIGSGIGGLVAATQLAVKGAGFWCWRTYYLPQNAGDIARKFIKDPELLSFIDAECFIVSTVNAAQTPMINASMAFWGNQLPCWGVGGIAKSLAKGLVDQGSEILYKANVTNIIMEGGKAVGVRLSDGREFFAKTIVSNATRWDTFGKLLKGEDLPKEEQNFQKLYVKAPSFLSIHMGVKAEILPPDTDCHHFVLEDNWTSLEKPYGSIFLSIPTILDSSLAPKGRHILHIFTTASMEDWKGMSQEDYEAKKELVAEEIISRLEKKLFPGLKSSIVFKEPGNSSIFKPGWDTEDTQEAIDGLYCVGDSCFPGQGVIAVAFSGVMCAHRIEKSSPVLDAALLDYLVG